MSSVLSVSSTINSCTLNFTNPLLEVNSASPSYLGKHFGTRLYHLMAVPVEIITRLADGILGITSFVAVLVTWGKMKSVYKFSMCHSMSFMSLPATLAQRFFLVINSKTEMREKNASSRLKNVGDAWMNVGIVSASFLNAIKFSNSTPDLVVASLSIPLLITSVVDGIFGMLAGVFALVALGVWKKCNYFVYEHLDFKTNIWFFCGLLVDPSVDLGINMENFNEQ